MTAYGQWVPARLEKHLVEVRKRKGEMLRQLKHDVCDAVATGRLSIDQANEILDQAGA